MSTNSVTPHHTGAWKLFTMASFAVAAAMMAGGIYFLEASFSAKGFYAMAAIMLVHTAITLTKTMRDSEEADRLINRVEDAKTEKLLMTMHRSDDL
ncbi:yiaA/B two helix domain protein [Hartmannibacter diazotrophicus]|uniref:YiaA/B two helix domain protein n=1 Tax=Hartmannibacter diazotrophicus TaxID=1482074 RepID=A0A2C9DC33_9HYPH|nr:YiaA/YiaB family inner membrane protein [Hartmannibacter diazotrophicus]SON57155.1 yiaA/B two helix domain protein [Hartmannibacter diazotrophicus]